MSIDDELEDLDGMIVLTPGAKICPLCDEALYSDTLYHLCKNDNNERYDIVVCPDCEFVIVLENRERRPSYIHEFLTCDCNLN
jgi:hypothetical protein